MKVCVSTDLLTERNNTIEVVETFLEIFDEATLVTISHNEGKILGPIEQRKIASSSITHKVKSIEDLHKYSFLVPGVLDNHFISCQYDLIINISRGLSHGFKKCETSKQLTYLLDEEACPKGKGIFEKIFKGYVNKWALKKLNQIDELWVSSESLKNKLQPFYSKEIIVVPPFIRVQDFPIIPKNVYPHNYYTINAEVIDEKIAKTLIKIFKDKKIDFRFIGLDGHLENIKSEMEDHFFLGVKCNGDLSPILAASRGLIDFSRTQFPALSISALSSGRPVIMPHNDFLKGNGVLTLENEEEKGILAKINELDQCHDDFEPEKLHALANKFHQLKFKGIIQRRILNNKP